MENVDRQVVDKLYMNFRGEVWGKVAMYTTIKIYFKLREQIHIRSSSEAVSQVKQNIKL